MEGRAGASRSICGAEKRREGSWVEESVRAENAGGHSRKPSSWGGMDWVCSQVTQGMLPGGPKSLKLLLEG